MHDNRNIKIQKEIPKNQKLAQSVYLVSVQSDFLKDGQEVRAQENIYASKLSEHENVLLNHVQVAHFH